MGMLKVDAKGKMQKEKGGEYELFGLPWYVFAILAVIVLISTMIGTLPSGMIGALSFMIILGTVFNEIGNKLPIVRSYLGGGAIVAIFASAALVYFGIINESTTEIVTNFMKTNGFLDFYIAALITGSILGMSKKLLVDAAIRYLPAIIGGVICALGFVFIAGSLIGYGGKEAMFFISIPIMGGGMGAGAVPLSQIFASNMGQSAEEILSIMVPAVALGNAVAIVCGGVLNKVGKKSPKLSGEGQLLRKFKNDSSALEAESQKDKRLVTIKNLGIGLLMSTTFFSVGTIISKFVPSIHAYAWMIIAVGIIKIAGWLPERLEICCNQWFQFIMTNLTPALLVGIGIAYTDLGEIISAFSLTYLVLVVVTVIGAVIGAGAVGYLVGFFPIESAITAGLCMANMGGTGDVAVLSAANRMELMPFGQISSRIGGAFMMILSSLLLQIFGKGL